MINQQDDIEEENNLGSMVNYFMDLLKPKTIARGVGAVTLLGSICFSGSYLRGCESRHNEYSAGNFKAELIDIGTGFSYKTEFLFLRVNGISYVPKTNERGELEGIVKIKRAGTEIETKKAVMTGTEYELRKKGEVELIVE